MFDVNEEEEIFEPWEDQDALRKHLEMLWDEVNIGYYAGKYKIDYQMTKQELMDFADSTFKHIVFRYYNGKHDATLRGFDLTGRKTSYAGKCRRWQGNDGDYVYFIILNYRFYEDWGNIQMFETILHEIGHMTVWHHNKAFWEEGRRIGYGLEMPGWKPRMAKWRLYCPHCDYEWLYLSKPRNSRCGSCYPDWQEWWNGSREWLLIQKNTDPDKMV